MLSFKFHVSSFKRMGAIIFFVSSCLFFGVSFANAAPLTDISYRLTSPMVGAYANHLAMFRSASGMTSGTISVNLLNVASSLSSVSISDLSLMYRGTKATLAATAGAGVWGASFSGTTVMFTYPVTGGTAIPAGSMVVISTIGGGARRPVNTATAGDKTVAIVAGADSGTATVALTETRPSNTEMINAAPGNGLRVGVSAGTNAGETGVALITEDSFGVSANRLDQVVTYGVGGILAPSDMVGTASGEGKIELGWQDNTNIGLGYIVERREVKENIETVFEPVAILDRESTRYTDINLKSQMQYQYRIRAFNNVNFSTALTSGIILTPPIAVPFAPLSGFIPGLAKRPTAPTPTVKSPTAEVPAQQRESDVMVRPMANVGNLTGIPGDGTAKLIWENSQNSDYLFTQIQWSDAGFPQSSTEGVTVFKEAGTSFTDEHLPNGQPSYYTVFAVSKYGVHSSGSFIAVTPSGPPPLPIVAPVAQPEAAAATSTAPEAPGQLESTPAEAAPQPVTLTLQPSVEKSFTASANGAVQIVNSDSLGGSQALAVAVPPDTVNASYQLSVAAYSLEQAKEIDASISVPAGHEIASQTIYRVTVEKEAVEVRKLEKPITLEFRYSVTSLGDVNERTLRARYWDPLASQWLDVPSKVDTEKKVVFATTNHLSLFSLFGERIETGQPSLLKIIARERLEKPRMPVLKSAMLFDLSQFVTVSGRELVATAGAETAFCITQELFPRPVRFMTVAINASKYFLVYDFSRRCYAGTVLMPVAVGSHAMQIKVVFADDFSQTGDFTLITTSKKPLIAFAPQIESLTAEQKTAQTPLAFLLIVLVAVFVIEGSIAWRTAKQWRR